MKKKFILPLLILTLSFTTVSSMAAKHEPATKEQVANMTEEEKQVKVQEINERVQEIRDMDKSSLSRSDKKELRQELKGLRKESREFQGLYISAGAIIIILLLILIL